jgi:hypothetical protein
MPRKRRKSRKRRSRRKRGRGTKRKFEEMSMGYLCDDSDSGDEYRTRTTGPTLDPPPPPLRFAKPSLPRGRRRNRTKKQKPEQMEIEQGNEDDWFAAMDEAHNPTTISRQKWHNSGGRKRKKRRKSRRKYRRKRRKSRKRRGGSLWGVSGMTANETRPITAYQIQKQKVPSLDWSLSEDGYGYQHIDPYGFDTFKEDAQTRGWDAEPYPILFKGYLSKRNKKKKKKSRKKRR